MSQKAFAEYFNIPVRTLQDWEANKRVPPVYVTELIKYKLEKENMIMEKLKLELFNKVLEKRDDLFIIPSFQEAKSYLHSNGYVNSSEDVEEDQVEEIEEAINDFLDNFTKKSIEKQMLKEARANELAWWENITKEEIIERDGEEHYNQAINDGSIAKTKYGYVFQPL